MTSLKVPSSATLKKYGMNAALWYTYLDLQGWKCPVCQREFSDAVKPCIDHEHVKNFKKMKPEQKVKYTRGILCLYCNLRRMPKGSKDLSPTEIAYNIYQYLLDYDMRSNEN